MPRVRAALCCSSAVIALLIESAAFRSHNSVTFDENFYLPAAKQLFRAGNFDECAEAGVAPLPLILAYGPAVTVRGDAISDVLWKSHPGDTDALDLARKTNALLVGVPLVLLTAGWVFRRTRSALAASAAAFAVALSPNVVAHASLATTDAGFTLFFLAALAGIAWHAVRPTRCRLLAAGGLIGLAISAKYGAILLFPVGYLVGLFADWHAPLRLSVWQSVCRAILVHPVRQIGLAFVALVVSWAVAGFTVFDRPLYPRSAAEVPAGDGPRKLVGNGPFGDAVINAAHAARLPTPVVGVVKQYAEILKAPGEATFPTYFRGRFYRGGFPLYFVFAVLFKSTPAELILLAIAGVSLVRLVIRRGQGEYAVLVGEAALVVGVGVLFLACSLSAKQFGVRYVLPLYPAAVILGVANLHDGFASRPRRLAVCLAALVAWQAWSAATILPRPLSYFNDLTGGPDRGHEWLGNSDVDWGQGARDLKTFLDAHGETAVVNRTFGAKRPGVYGFADADFADPPHCRYVAVGMSRLNRNLTFTPELVPFRGLPTAHVVGYSINVYDTTDPGVLAACRAALAARRAEPDGATDASR